MISKKKIKVAIDSPAAAGAGTQAKLISKVKNSGEDAWLLIEN